MKIMIMIIMIIMVSKHKNHQSRQGDHHHHDHHDNHDFEAQKSSKQAGWAKITNGQRWRRPMGPKQKLCLNCQKELLLNIIM